ncbi:MAG: hypothetical protein ABWX90_02305 [Candidatus Saccharimonadales bacterium]
METPDVQPKSIRNQESSSKERHFASPYLPRLAIIGGLALTLTGAAVYSAIEANTHVASNTAQDYERALTNNALLAIQSGPSSDSTVYGNFRVHPDDSPYHAILSAKDSIYPPIETNSLASHVAIETSAKELIKMRDNGTNVNAITLFSADIDNNGTTEVLAKLADVTGIITVSK